LIKKLTDTAYTYEGEQLPWFTLPCLEWLIQQDLSDKTILEYGSGFSTLWLAKRCKDIVSIEANKEWYNKIVAKLIGNLKDTSHYLLRETNEGEQDKIDFYCNAPDSIPFPKQYDIVIVDGILRNECLQKAIKLLSKKGGIIIADNWIQSYVWMSPAAIEIMKPYEVTIFEQSDHINNDGINKWKTAVFKIPKT
jgi:predicted O-methyltransferase YrrM